MDPSVVILNIWTGRAYQESNSGSKKSKMNISCSRSNLR